MTTLPVLDQQEESLCRRCGMSCHMAIEVGTRHYIVEEIHCRYLARPAEGHYECTVYPRRFEVAPWCHTAKEAAVSGNLASDCLYAIGIPNYRGKEWAPPEIRRQLMPVIRRKLIADGLPLSNDPESALRVLNVQGEHWTYAELADHFVFHRQP